MGLRDGRLESGHLAAWWCPLVRQLSEAVDVDRGQLVG